MRYQSWVCSMSLKKKRDSKWFWGLFFICFTVWLLFHPIQTRASIAFERQFSNVSIGFAAQNTYQPESSFGHVFLIFHEDTFTPDDVVLEFVGVVKGFADVVRTLVGDVPGHYLVQTYAEKRRQYDLEDRGLFFANLLLQQDEITALVQEVRLRLDKTYPYDFAQKNCAYYLADLLTTIEPRMVQVKGGANVLPAAVMRAAVVGGGLNLTFTPSSRELFLQHKSSLSVSDRELFELFLRGHHINFVGENFQNTAAAFLRYRIPREAVTWRRQQYAQAQKHVFLKDENVGASAAFDEGGRGHVEATLMQDKLVLAYRPQQENFFSQPSIGTSYAYLELFSTEVTFDSDNAWLSSFNLLSSKSMNLEKGSARVLELGYRDWRGVSVGSEKEVFATFGLGLSTSHEKKFISLVPLIGVAAGSAQKTEAEIRLGYEINAEARTSFGSVGFDVKQWFGSRLTPDQLYLMKAKFHIGKNFNLGYARLWGTESKAAQHQIKLTYSVR